MKKHVIFVRHGESVANASGIRMHDNDANLTERGRVQVFQVAERLAHLQFARVISSTYPRAQETGEAIARRLYSKIEHSPLFIERVNPSIMLGRTQDDPEMEKVWDIIKANYHIPGWKHSDEENFEDLHARAKKALTYLESLSEPIIVVATHGMFMKMIFATVALGDHLSARMFWDSFIPMKNVKNTGIMHLEFTENYHKTAYYWKLISWNDHAHLR